MKLHRGINITSVAGEGLNGLPGLLITVAFVCLFAGIFVPRESGKWFLFVFLAIETGAAILYILIARRNREDSQRLKIELHRINDQPNR